MAEDRGNLGEVRVGVRDCWIGWTDAQWQQRCAIGCFHRPSQGRHPMPTELTFRYCRSAMLPEAIENAVRG